MTDPRNTPEVEAAVARVFAKSPKTAARERYVRFSIWDQRGLLTPEETHELLTSLAGHDDLDDLMLAADETQTAIHSLPAPENAVGSPWLYPKGNPNAPLAESPRDVLADLIARGLLVTDEEKAVAERFLMLANHSLDEATQFLDTPENMALLPGVRLPLIHRAAEISLSGRMRLSGLNPHSSSVLPPIQWREMMLQSMDNFMASWQDFEPELPKVPLPSRLH